MYWLAYLGIGALVGFAAGLLAGSFAAALAAGWIPTRPLTIPFLTWCKVPLRRAIGTAAANGLPIALAGTAGYVLHGVSVPGLPAWSLGYIYLPALALVVTTSMATAPLGARLAHRLPIKRLRQLFAVLLYGFAVRMLAGVW